MAGKRNISFNAKLASHLWHSLVGQEPQCKCPKTVAVIYLAQHLERNKYLGEGKSKLLGPDL